MKVASKREQITWAINMSEKNISGQFDSIDEQIEMLEENSSTETNEALDKLVTDVSLICRKLLETYAGAYDKQLPDSNDLLELFKAFVKGDPSLTATRDNIRELVYYRNCINENRFDALPQNPHKMALHTIRHIYLYLRSRADQEGLLD